MAQSDSAAPTLKQQSQCVVCCVSIGKVGRVEVSLPLGTLPCCLWVFSDSCQLFCRFKSRWRSWGKLLQKRRWYPSKYCCLCMTLYLQPLNCFLPSYPKSHLLAHFLLWCGLGPLVVGSCSCQPFTFIKTSWDLAVRYASAIFYTVAIKLSILWSSSVVPKAMVILTCTATRDGRFLSGFLGD